MQRRTKYQPGGSRKPGNTGRRTKGFIARERIRFIKPIPIHWSAVFTYYVVQDHIPVDELESLYNSLGDPSGEVVMYDVGGKIAAKKTFLVGMEAPLFEMNDVEGNNIKLADTGANTYCLISGPVGACPAARKHPTSYRL